jgi:hypothetical protein
MTLDPEIRIAIEKFEAARAEILAILLRASKLDGAVQPGGGKRAAARRVSAATKKPRRGAP